MRRSWKKALAVLTTTALTASMLAACGGGKDETTAANSGAGKEETTKVETETTAADKGTTAADTQASATPTEVTYPLEKGEKITYWVQLNGNASANYTNLGDTEFGKALKEQTGIDVEFQHPAAGQEKEQFNLIIADGNLPDIMEYQWVKGYPGGPEKAIRDGVIIPLNDVIDKYCPNLKAFLAEHPEFDKMIKTDDGHYYAFPFLRGEEKLCVNVGGFIRQDWLDELGLEVPTTIDEWHTVLTAFKEKKGAEAALCFDWANFKDKNQIIFAYDTSYTYYVGEDGKVHYGPMEDNFKDYLTTMHQWYQEGLLDKDMASLNGDQVISKMTTDKAGASVGWAASRMQVCMTTAQKSNPNYTLAATPFPSLEKGKAPKMGFIENAFPDVSAAITTKCKDVERAARLLDYAYGEAGHNLYNFGVEGVSYEMKDGIPTYTDIVLNNPDGWPLAQSMAKHIRGSYNGPFVQDGRYIEQYLQLPTVKECPTTWYVEGANKYNLPNVTPLQDESKELATLNNEITTYVDEMVLKFILGTESLDNWDTYVNTIKGMNIDRALEIYNGALDRYNAR